MKTILTDKAFLMNNRKVHRPLTFGKWKEAGGTMKWGEWNVKGKWKKVED